MKVVLFCGGLGTRLREHSETIPKPLVPIGYQPILWHLMRYYAHFGHNEFILCLGHRADLIRDYFLNHDPALDADVRVSDPGRRVEFLEDFVEWNVSLVDTGINANIGERLRAAALRASVREGKLRVSPHFFNTEAEVDRLLEVL